MQRNTGKERSKPNNSIKVSELIHSNKSEKQSKLITQNTHETQCVQIEGREEVFFFKKNQASTRQQKTDHKNSEYEAAAGELYNYLIGDQAASVMGVVNDENVRIGVVSQAIDGYITFKAVSEAGQISFVRKSNIPKAKLMNGKTGAVLVAAYVFDENDLHLENIGFNKEGKVVKIDHGQSFFSLTRKFTPFEHEAKYHITIHAEDIESFPILKKANPRRWVIDGFKTSALNAMSKDQTFIEEKYYSFLKALIFPRSLITEVARNNFSTENGAKRFEEYINNRLESLGNELAKLDSFRDFMKNQAPHICAVLISEFPDAFQDETRNNFDLVTEQLAMMIDQGLQFTSVPIEISTTSISTTSFQLGTQSYSIVSSENDEVFGSEAIEYNSAKNKILDDFLQHCSGNDTTAQKASFKKYIGKEGNNLLKILTELNTTAEDLLTIYREFKQRAGDGLNKSNQKTTAHDFMFLREVKKGGKYSGEYSNDVETYEWTCNAFIKRIQQLDPTLGAQLKPNNMISALSNSITNWMSSWSTNGSSSSSSALVPISTSSASTSTTRNHTVTSSLTKKN